ncbi:MAG: DNA repair protein RecN [Bacillota bacterium]
MRLHIENLAIIDSLDIEFCPGLNVFTGETGAGKSIVVDALELVTGGRASSEVVRTGASTAVVEGMFDLSAWPSLGELLRSMGFEADDCVVLTREVSSSGRSACRINGRLASVGMLRQIGSRLVDIHGQHEGQALLDPAQQLLLLDHFAGEEALRLRAETEQIKGQLGQLRQELNRLCGEERELARRVDLLRYQVDEIDRAQLRPGEEEELVREHRLLNNAVQLREAVGKAKSLLFLGRGASATDMVGEAIRELEQAARIDNRLANFVEALEQVSLELEDLRRDMTDYEEGVCADPERLAQVERRLDLLGDLKRKYGEDIPAILEFRARAQAELDKLTHREALAAELEQQIAKLAATLGEKANRLHQLRAEAGTRLGEQVTQVLKGLGMPDVQFQVRLGDSSAQFWFSANLGEDPRELHKVASGGELSRIMLAIKTVSLPPESAGVLVFDEVDAGVSGVVAHRIGALLVRLSGQRQVMCVTHLPQIAALADSHFAVVKESSGGRTVTRVHKLGSKERLLELARMMGDSAGSEISIQHAKQLLMNAQEIKRSAGLSG